MPSDDADTPGEGTPVEYDGTFRSPERPAVPVVHGDGVGREVVPAARRVLDAAAETTGRAVEWVRLHAGDAARERYGTPLPEETVETLRDLRVGLVGPLRRDADEVYGALCRRLDLHANVYPTTPLAGVPTPVPGAGETDIVLFREATEDVAGGIEFAPGAAALGRARRFLAETLGDRGAIHDGPAGLGVRPITEFATERVVERAVEYALDADRDAVTVVHQGDLTPATDASFREWALAHVGTEYAGATVTEAAFREEYGGTYPEDEVVVGTREATEVCRDLVTDPAAYDVLVAPALCGVYVSDVAAAVTGGRGVAPGATVGDGRVIAGPRHGPAGAGDRGADPIATIRSGCLLFETIGWDDTAAVTREAVETALAPGPRTRDRDAALWTSRSTDAFVDRVVDHLGGGGRSSPDPGVRTTPEERTAIKRAIVSLHNTVFEDRLSERELELNQLRGDDEEAEIYLPAVGINFRYWRLWSVERRIEVLLHELAHVENYEDDHAPAFYDRLVELTEIAEDRRSDLEASFGTTIDFDLVKRHVVESVHEETIEPDVETVAARQRRLCDAFDLSDVAHY